MKHPAAAVVCITFVLLCIGLLQPSTARSRTASSSPSSAPEQTSLACQHLIEAGSVHYNQMHLRAAQQVFAQAQATALAQQDRRCAIRAASNQMAASFALLDYRQAAATYQQARSVAEQIQDWQMLGVMATNFSSLLMRIGDYDAALVAVQDAQQAFQRYGPSRYYALCLLQHAMLLATPARNWKATPQGMAQALPFFQAAINEADHWNDPETQILAWEQRGGKHLSLRQLAEAERCFLEAYRLRSLLRQPIGIPLLLDLGLLHMAQNRYGEAQSFLTLALQQARSQPSAVPLWQLLATRGAVARRQQRWQEAYADYRAAVDDARTWRATVLPGEAAQQGASVRLHEVYEGLIAAGVALQHSQGGKRLTGSLLEAAEENRAITLRERFAAEQAAPLHYGELLAQYRATVSQALPATGGQRGRLLHQAHTLQVQLHALEMQTALPLPSSFALQGQAATPSSFVARARRTLQPDEAYLSFHISDEGSYLWTVTRQTVTLHRLPAAQQLGQAVQDVRHALQAEGDAWRPAARRAAQLLLGEVPPAVRQSRRWMLGLDGPLFEMPFAALLMTGPEGTELPLAALHTLQTVPGFALFSPQPHSWQGGFVGVGDPIYNQADSRFTASRPAPPRAPWWSLQAASLPTAWTRLAASGREVRACAQTWLSAQPPVVLTGREATPEQVHNSLGARPAVLHFATHVVHDPEQPDEGLLLLSLSDKGEPRFLSATEISRWRAPLPLVMMNGCQSGGGTALPGAGWLGLTRAWLAAGAQNVIATHWPTLDDGHFSTDFYQALRRTALHDSRAAADALSQAQRSAFQAGGPLSHPRHWAAYFIVGRG